MVSISDFFFTRSASLPVQSISIRRNVCVSDNVPPKQCGIWPKTVVVKGLVYVRQTEDKSGEVVFFLDQTKTASLPKCNVSTELWLG